MNDRGAGSSGTATEDFDVFLNHRGPDVKATFVAHLEDALRCAGFRPFLDARSLMKGNPALQSIDEALAMAKVHVAVVSRRYAESKYCLRELVAMMRSGKSVVPVFYNVEPVDLRWVENGPFAEAFENHKLKRRSEKEVQEWRDALGALAALTGFRLADYKGDEAKLKREVVDEVRRLTPSNDPVDVEQFRVGLEGPSERCIRALEEMGGRIGMLGLVGMGGVGKTTLAREIYNHFVARKTFMYMTFLEVHGDPSSSNVQVRPTWSRKLRKQLLWDLLRVQHTTSNYRSWFQKVSTLGPVFIVIDDVHKLGQFEELVPFTSSLHPGSRIVVTSRDRSILNMVAARAQMDHHVFDVSTLDSEQSRSLFNWHAFQSEEAPKDYKDLAKDVVEACGGLPLALKVIGSSLCDKRLDGDRETIWAEAISALRQSRDVMDVLRWSYDSLEESEKRMFLDITCLFDGSGLDAAYWESCKSCTSCGGVGAPHTSLRNLISKNLVATNCVRCGFRVHDLLRHLGQEIGRKSKSHIMDVRMAEATVMKNQGSEKMMMLDLGGSRKRKFQAENFSSMPNLHFLRLPEGCVIDGDFGCMSQELRWLQWKGMPLAHAPAGLNLSLVTSLDFSGSTNLASLWTEANGDMEAWPNLCRLDLSGCTSITKLPDSIGQSLRLQRLKLRDCKKLKELPKSIGHLSSLSYLDIDGCTSLKALPESMGSLSNLRHLPTNMCSFVEFPSWIRRLSRLEVLEISTCTKFVTLFRNCDGLLGYCDGEKCWIMMRRRNGYSSSVTEASSNVIREILKWLKGVGIYRESCNASQSQSVLGYIKDCKNLEGCLKILMPFQILRIYCF